MTGAQDGGDLDIRHILADGIVAEINGDNDEKSQRNQSMATIESGHLVGPLEGEHDGRRDGRGTKVKRCRVRGLGNCR